MDALDSPLEALALNYLTYGFLTVVNNMWAWVAVITAAVSFWRIRALSPPELRGGRCQDNAASTSSNAAAVADQAAEDTDIVSSAVETVQFSKTFSRILERECSTKTKFSLYYEVEAEDFREDDGGDCDGEDNRSDDEAAAEMRSIEELDYFLPRRCDDWERVMVVKRMGDMGWYRWQDMTVLDGSVVRLWERRRRC